MSPESLLDASDIHLLFQVTGVWRWIGKFLENNQNMLMFLKQPHLLETVKCNTKQSKIMHSLFNPVPYNQPAQTTMASSFCSVLLHFLGLAIVFKKCCVGR